MPIFRLKVSCFFCGEQTAPGPATRYHPNHAIKYFACQSCGADNHLDANGEIVDHVPETRDNPIQYARSLHQRTCSLAADQTDSDRSPSPPSPTFCRECQQNQLIVNTAKAEFHLPPEDHPDYEYQTKVVYPARVQELEERWPPVCPNCAPKVAQRLRKSNYNAKVASLGHMRARTDKLRESQGGYDPKKTLASILWILRGFVCVASHTSFIFWHGTAMWNPQGSEIMEQPTLRLCLIRSIEASEVDATCTDMVAWFVDKCVLLTLLGFGWVYRESQLEGHPEKKLVGVREYFQQEVITTAIRFLSWYLLGPGGVNFTKETSQRMHIGFLLLFFVTTVYSFTCLKLEHPRSFSLKETISLSRTPETLSPPDSPRNHNRSRPLHQSTLRNQVPKQTPPPLRMCPIRPAQPIPSIVPAYREKGSAIESPETPLVQLRQRAYQPQQHQPQKLQRVTDDADAMDWNPTNDTQSQPSIMLSLGGSWRSDGHISTSSPFSQVSHLGIKPQAQPAFGTQASLGNQNNHPSPPPNLFNQPKPTPIGKPNPENNGGFRRLQDPRFKPLPEPSFKGIPDTSLDSGFESMFDKGLKFEEESEIIPEISRANSESEPIVHQLLRLSILMTATLALVKQTTWWMVIVSMASVAAVASWQAVLYSGQPSIWVMVAALGSLLVTFIVGFGLFGQSAQTKLLYLVLLLASGQEFSGILARMERYRSRKYHLLESKRKRKELSTRNQQREQNIKGESLLRMFGGR